MDGRVSTAPQTSTPQCRAAPRWAVHGVIVGLAVTCALAAVVLDPRSILVIILLFVGVAGVAYLGSRLSLRFLLATVMISSLVSHYEIVIAGESVRAEHIVGSAMFAVFVVHRVLMSRRIASVDGPLLLVCGWVSINALASAVNAPLPSQSFVHVIRMIILAGIYITVANGVASAGNDWVGTVRVWIVLGSLELLYGISAWVLAVTTGLRIGVLSPPHGSFLAIYGTTLERNVFGSLSASILVMSLSLWFHQRRFSGRALFAKRSLVVGLLLSSLALLLSYTRAAWVAALVGGFFAYLGVSPTMRGRLVRLRVLGLAVVILAAVGVILVAFAPSQWSLVSRIGSFIELGSDPTWLARLDVNRMAIEDWLRHPIVGNGPGSFSQLRGSIRGQPAWIGNLFLHTLVDTGLTGLLIQVALFVVIIVGALNAARVTVDLRLRSGLLALTSGLLTLLVAYQATDATWFAAFWIHMALIAGVSQYARHTSLSSPRQFSRRAFGM